MEQDKNKTKDLETVYVVYWIDLDDDCLKKSEIQIVGVYSKESIANSRVDKLSHKEGNANDCRCHYASSKTMIINKTNEEFKDYELNK